MAFFLSLALWRDISIIWLSLLCLIGLVLPLALAYLAARGMDIALKKAELGLHKAQSYSRIARAQTNLYSAQARKPVIRVHRALAHWQRVGDALWPRRPTAGAVPGRSPGATNTDTAARPAPHARDKPFARTTRAQGKTSR